MDNLEHQEIQLLVKNIIKSWWDKECAVQVTVNNDKTSVPVNKFSQSCSNNFKNFTEKLTALESKLDDVVLENNRLKNEIEILKRQSNTRQITKPLEQIPVSGINVQQNVSLYSPDRIIEIFNEWAGDPNPHLPSKFSYTDGELRLREKQVINNAGNENSLWIVYKSGQIIFLFPNPNVIDQIGGDIDAVYTVTGTRKAKGQNKIAIRKACEIKEDGWIEYKGALDLL